MKTDDLIAAIAAEEPRVDTTLSQILSWATGAAVLTSALTFFAIFGFRPDISVVAHAPRFLAKFAVTIPLAVAAVALIFSASRPGVPHLGARKWTLLIGPLLLCAAVAIELFTVPSDTWLARMVGHFAMRCLICIPILAAGPLVCFFLALRLAAPTYPGIAGAIAGLAASGIAATFYAANCPDDSPLFLAVWYTLATLAISAVGYLMGRRFLRW